MTDNHAHLLDTLAKQDAADGITGTVVGAVIPRDNTVLILQRAADDYMGGMWELPSGTVDPDDQDLIAALRREVEEETSLTVVEVGEYLGSFDYLSSKGHKHRQHNWTVVTSGEAAVSHEHDALQWADTEGQKLVSSAVQDVLSTWQNVSRV